MSHDLQSPQEWVLFMARGRLRLPDFQRGWCWTDEQIIRLVDSLLLGYHLGSLILWERHKLPASVERFGEIEVRCAAGPGRMVIDGQQRLGALATAALSERFFVDVLAGRLVTEPGPWRLPARLFLAEHGSGVLDHYAAHAAQYGLPPDQVFDAAGITVSAVESAYVGAVRFDADWTRERVVESFRRLNTEGTRFTAEQLDAALARSAG